MSDKVDAERYRWILEHKPTIRHHGKLQRWFVSVWERPTNGPMFSGVDSDLGVALDALIAQRKGPE